MKTTCYNAIHPWLMAACPPPKVTINMLDKVNAIVYRIHRILLVLCMR